MEVTDINLAVTLKFLEVTDLSELRIAIGDAVQLLLPQTKCCMCYLLDGSTGELLCGGANTCSCLPKQGILWQAYQSRHQVVTDHLHPEDPLVSVLQQKRSNSQSLPKSVVVCPVISGGSEVQVVAVLVISCDQSRQINAAVLQPVEKQIAACYRRLQRTHPPRRASEETRTDALVNLCEELYDQDAASLQLKVIKYLEQQTQAECAFLLLVVPETQDLFCQAVGAKLLQEEVRFPGHSSSFAVALETKQSMSLEDIPLDKRKGLEEFVALSLHSLQCVPVTNRNNDDLIALVCLVNKLGGDRFTEEDVSKVHQCFRYTATVLTSTLAFQNERKLKNQTQAMLAVARNLFTHLDDLTKLLREIMQEARNLTQAERCSVFLIDEEADELVAKVFDGISTDNEVQTEIRMPITQGIAGHVATAGQLLNIKDAYSHPLFYRGIDDSTGFRTRNILCFPIKDEKGVVMGVAQLCNKKTGLCFTTFDEEIASAFAVYCCISISHSLLYKRMQDSQHRSKLANELMIYHMQVAHEDVTTYSHCKIPEVHTFHVNFDQFSYAPRTLPEDDTLLATLSMLDDLGFISRFRIRRDTLARFFLMVKKGYRNPPYHNWMHAYTVTQFCYLGVKNLGLLDCLDELEIFALFVSCLCHDIDHRGTNNSYQMASQSVLASLYSSEGSVLERHHFAQAMCILNTDGCNIFENLTSKEYQKCLDLMRDIILATDLAHHLRILKNLESMAKEGYDKSNPKNHKLLLCLMMTASDLSDQTKPWSNTKLTASLIYREFFSQGDLEKAMGKEPIEMMDRERARIPDLQISFLDHIALPVFRLLAELFQQAAPVASQVEENHQHWEKLCSLVKLRRGGSSANMSIDQVIALDYEADKAENEMEVDSEQTVQQNGN